MARIGSIFITLFLLGVVVVSASNSTIHSNAGEMAIKCDICTHLVPIVEKALTTFGCGKVFNGLVHLACTELGFASTCETMLDDSCPEILAVIEENIPALVICQKVGLCPLTAV